MRQNRLAADLPHSMFPIVSGVAFAAFLMAWPAVAQSQNKAVTLVSLKPTALFAHDGDRLSQIVELAVENTGSAVRANLEFKTDSATHSLPLGTIQQGRSTIQIRVPDVRHATTAQFVLKTDGASADIKQIDWQPRKHWTVYFVPITHHDLGYTDTIENVLNRYAGFYDDVLRFCDQTSDWPEEAKYRYTLEATWSLQHFIENRPKEVIDRFGAYVREGRIEIGALFGNEIDSLCGHEQQIRLMYPSFRFVHEYGGKISVGSLTDLPGLSWGMPTILSGAGVKYFFAGLPTYFEWGRNDIHTFWDESSILRHGRPDAFRWQGPDGQSVLVYYQGSYGFFKRVVGPDSYEEVMEALPGMLDEMDDKGSPFDVMRYIHNGVDNHPPDMRISEVVKQWNAKWAYPKLVVATNTMFFKALEGQCGDVRTFRGELPHTDYVVGALSTAKETTINRLTHDKLLSAEKAATIASLVCDHDYPADKIARAYDDMLLYDEHTWGKDYPAGPLEDWAWNEKSHYAYRAAGLTQSVLTEGLDRIAQNIQIEQQGRHIVVFNPLAFDRTDVVRVARFPVSRPFDVIDNETGRVIPCQVAELDGPLAAFPYAPHRWARGQFEKRELFDLIFIAQNVPSMGYKTYRIVPRESWPTVENSLTVAQDTIENRFFKVALDPKTGAISSLYDKELARELVDQQAQDKLNQFVAKWVQTSKREGPACTDIRIGHKGPVCASLIAIGSGAGCPQIVQEVVLYDQLKRIDLFNRVLKDSTPLLEVYFAFPFGIDEPKFRFEGSNSVIEPFKDQFPGSNTNYYAVQHWASVSNKGLEVILSPIESHLLEFGGLWPCYCSQAHHGVTAPDFGKPFVRPEQITKGHIYSFVLDSNFRTNFQPVQQSDILFRYCLTSRDRSAADSERRDVGWSAHNPLTAVVIDGPRQGKLDQQASFCRLDASNVLLATLKRAEDSRGFIARLIETDGRSTTTTLTMPGLPIEKAWLTNLVEENQVELDATDHAVSVPVRACGIATVRLQVRPE